MSDINNFGAKGEDVTAEFLKRHGFLIFKRNYHSRFGEIDIIAEKGNLIIFVEVKTRFCDALVLPKEAVDPEKQRRIKMTAREFVSKLHYDYKYRFDVCEVYVTGVPGSYKYSINYIKSAFN